MNVEKLKQAFNKSLRPALMSSLWAFIGMFSLSFIGWLDDIGAWFDSDAATEFPNASVLIQAARSAFMAAMVGVVGGVVRFVQALTGRGTVPTYQ